MSLVTCNTGKGPDNNTWPLECNESKGVVVWQWKSTGLKLRVPRFLVLVPVHFVIFIKCIWGLHL